MKGHPQRTRLQAEEIARRVESDPACEPLETAINLCGKDEVLLMEVVGLLGAKFASRLDARDQPPYDPLVNQKIGGFKTHWKLGSGGNGDVYLATRIKEPHQQVAMKFLRLRQGESDQFRRRFLRERQIIAVLNHPYIVKLFDADRTKEGVPYFVMEYVRGSELDRFANNRRLTVTERIRLFLKVCGAIQYLHQHLIVHRDLKPANIMVDDDGNPRILDFGIAKLLQPELMDGDLITVQNQDPLTPQYASPEQWQGQLVTSASDVYSLGVILFLLLTGRPPLAWSGTTPAEYRQRLCTGGLPKASRSVMEGHAGFCRELHQATLEQKLSGDLDAILAKALHHDVVERYPTVEALAEDLDRHLQFLPVRARGESSKYRLRRFLRRNRALAGSTIAMLLALSLGLGGTIHEWKRAQKSAVEAQTERDTVVDEKRQVESELDRVRQLAQQRSSIEKTLEADLQAKDLQQKKFRIAVQRLAEDLQKTIVDDEQRRGKDRGEASADDSAQYKALGKKYQALAGLLGVLSDEEGARQANQNCALNFTRAERAGDDSVATANAARRCREALLEIKKH